MKKIGLAILALGLILAMVLPAGAVYAAPPTVMKMHASTFLNGSNVPDGSVQVLDITYNEINDGDSGIAGNDWATDNWNATVQVWQTPDGSYFAIEKDSGQFTTIAGAESPAGTGLYEGSVPVTGTYQGGYTMTIPATQVLDPDAVNGDLGTFNKNNFPSTTGVFHWIGKVFDSPFDENTDTLVNWGWTYTYQNQIWNNFVTSNGDIYVP